MEISLQSILMIIQIFVIAGGGVTFLLRIEGKLGIVSDRQVNFQADMNKRVDNIEKEMEKLVEVTVKQARQDERMTAQDVRIATLQAQMIDFVKPDKSSPRRNKG